MYKVIINLESSQFPYEVWRLDINKRMGYIQDGEWVDAFSYLEDAISRAESLNMESDNG